MPSFLRRSWIRYVCYALVGIVFTLCCGTFPWQPIHAQSPGLSPTLRRTLSQHCATSTSLPALAPVEQIAIVSPLSVEQQQQLDAGQQAYEAGRLSEAEGILKTALNEFRVQGDEKANSLFVCIYVYIRENKL